MNNYLLLFCLVFFTLNLICLWQLNEFCYSLVKSLNDLEKRLDDLTLESFKLKLSENPRKESP